ncbi:RluA family pseudouridine synthase [Gammaproteobacteria bacterium]|jgi:23S rRNA pseudouridine955/2504/2580 synthase|nr:RluA family pseudouridine synthase [Gammaproteobacteria bacterium]MDC0906629.1 RluA family pseudouridine synthase [Gammaproteobacteria bacterium]
MDGKNLNIIEDHAGRRIDNYLINVYKSLPKSKIYSMIRKGEIRVNSGRIKPTYKLKLNDEIRIPPYLIDFNNDEPDIKIPPSRIKSFNSSIIYQNDDYIVVNKEPELSVHSGTNNQFGLIDIARATFPLLEIDLCHRIDKSTSGCVLLSKNKTFLRHFNKQLKSNEVVKKYEAILVGVMKNDMKIETKIDLSTKEHHHRVQEAEHGKKAVSFFKILKKYNTFSHVEILITTGRMHQIRVQSSNLNHPIVNDKKYGLFDLNKSIAKETSINRLALHAASISFLDLNRQKVNYLATKNNEFDILLSQLNNLTVKI